MVTKVVLANPRGFCAGVARAVDVVDKAIAIYGSPLYVKHAIVHNIHVIEDLEKKGAVFVESVAEIPEGAVAVFSAHGSPPEQYEQAKLRNIMVVDATCPLVNKVHLEAKLFAKKGVPIIYVGHRGHPEGIGVGGEVAEIGGVFHLVDNIEEARAFSLPSEDVAILTQTTLSLSDVKEILAILQKKFPKTQFPPQKDVCYATENRQKAIKELAREVDCIFVVGSKTSSNSNRLREVAEDMGVPAYLIDDALGIDPTWLARVATVGISAGASAPEYLVDELIAYFTTQGATEIVKLDVIKENIFFPLPVQVRGVAVPQVTTQGG